MNKRYQIVIVLLLAITGILLYNNYAGKVQPPAKDDPEITQNEPRKTDGQSIDELTRESVVVPYVKQNHKLPDYYITKSRARANGWIASEGNLCKVLPGKAIGGDVFSNRENNLPAKSGRKWFEADLNYNCGRRNADRLLFSSDGLVFVTYDHYKTFREK